MVSRLFVLVMVLLTCGQPAVAGKVVVSSGLMNQLTTAPGATGRVTIAVSNQSETTQTVQLTIADFQAGAHGVEHQAPGNAERSAAGWIRLPSSTFEIPAQGTTEITLDVDVPEDLVAEGSYWAAILLQEPPPPRQAGSSIQQVWRTSVKVVVHVGDQGTSQVTIKGATQVASNRGPVLVLDVGNAGTRADSGNATVEFFGRDGLRAARVTSADRIVYPGVDTRFRIPLRRIPPAPYTVAAYTTMEHGPSSGAQFNVTITPPPPPAEIESPPEGTETAASVQTGSSSPSAGEGEAVPDTVGDSLTEAPTETESPATEAVPPAPPDAELGQQTEPVGPAGEPAP